MCFHNWKLGLWNDKFVQKAKRETRIVAKIVMHTDYHHCIIRLESA